MIQRIVSTLLALGLLVAVFVFASILVALAVTAGLLLWAGIWWRGRARRAQVVEGEYRIIEIR
jgi:hypothetical protein